MSLIVFMETDEGLLLAGDSRLTRKNDPTWHKDDVHKIFECNQKIGIAYHGDAEVDGICMEQFISLFIDSHPSAVTVEEVALGLKDAVSSYQQIPDTYFYIMGYERGKRRVLKLYKGELTDDSNSNHGSGGSDDIAWGMIEGNWEKHATKEKALEFIAHIYDETIKGETSVGGAIDILLLRKDGTAKWIQKKGVKNMFFKKKKEETVFKQDLQEKNEHSGLVFAMQLFMKEKCSMPDAVKIQEVMEKHLGDVQLVGSSDEVASFAVDQYKVTFKEGTAAPMLLITGCCESGADKIDAFTRSQMWDCPEHERILSECGYQVVATDMLAGAMEAADRAEMLMNYLEALVELYPMCEAVYVQNSGKMFTVEQIRNHTIPKESRFIYFAVNVRFFNIQGTEDMMVDTLGMSVLSLPDLQYHFHGMDPNAVVNHAYNMLSYIFASGNPIKNNDTIDGIAGGQMSRDVQWRCHYEDALIQPPRPVIDICMNEYASGGREY